VTLTLRVPKKTFTMLAILPGPSTVLPLSSGPHDAE